MFYELTNPSSFFACPNDNPYASHQMCQQYYRYFKSYEINVLTDLLAGVAQPSLQDVFREVI